jgi:ribonuclease VapC
MSTVNLSEVVAKLIDVGVPDTSIRGTLGALGLATVEFDSELAYKAGLLRAATRRAGLSLGDRACLSLAEHLGLPALTADRAWASLGLGIPVRVIR